MDYTRLGRSNLLVSKICLGTMHFGTRTPEDEALKIMDRALEMGINFFDTANAYGRAVHFGLTEEIIGRWLKQGNGRRDQVVLATKVYAAVDQEAPRPNEGKGISAYKVRKQAADLLRRLQTDRIDLYQVHHIDRQITLEEFWTTFDRLVQAGEVLHMGTSNFPGWGLAKYQMYAQQHGMFGFVSEQPMYNLLCRYPELEIIPAAQEFGIGILPYMPLAGGLLTGKKEAVKGSRTSDVENEYKLSLTSQQFEDYSAFCQSVGESESAVAIAWTLANPGVSSAIVGVRTVEHLDILERAASLKLEPEQLAHLDELFNINRGRLLKAGASPEAFAW